MTQYHLSLIESNDILLQNNGLILYLLIIMDNRILRQNEQEKVYMVWKCPTHSTSHKPKGKDPKRGCSLVQYSTKHPLRNGGKGIQFNCKNPNCKKKPRMHPKDIILERSKTPEHLAFVKDYCHRQNNPTNDDILDQHGVTNHAELMGELM